MGGPSQSTETTQNNLTTAETNLANTENSNAQTLFGESNPGFQTAENYYQGLASGNPAEIFKLISPATSQISQQSATAANQIKQNTPRGGAQNLALAQNDITKASQIGNLATSAYTSAFPALAQIGGSGIGLSTGQANTAISGLNAASSSNQALASQQNAAKASTMGFLGSLAGVGGSLGGAALSGGGALGASALGKPGTSSAIPSGTTVPG
jgi:hypothetical protein